MALHNMNGIVGDKPVLTYSEVHERWTASFPGYDKDVAQLPHNTVDAVLTSNGMLVYKDSKNEVRGLTIPNHGEILRAIHGVKEKSVKAFSNSLAADKITVGKVEAISLLEKEREAYAELLSRVQRIADELVLLRGENRRLSDRIDVMEERKRLAAKIMQGTKPAEMPVEMENKMRSTSMSVDVYDIIDTIEPAWGDRGGIVSGLLPEDGNPFCGRLRRR